jgi:hypothetical protein
MKAKIIITVDINGISKDALDECEDELRDILSETVESGDYFLTHPETEKEYEVAISVQSVEIER